MVYEDDEGPGPARDHRPGEILKESWSYEMKLSRRFVALPCLTSYRNQIEFKNEASRDWETYILIIIILPFRRTIKNNKKKKFCFCSFVFCRANSDISSNYDIMFYPQPHCLNFHPTTIISMFPVFWLYYSHQDESTQYIFIDNNILFNVHTAKNLNWNKLAHRWWSSTSQPLDHSPARTTPHHVHRDWIECGALHSHSRIFT